MLDKKQHITGSSIFFSLYQNCLKRINNRPWSNVKDRANTEEIGPKMINDHCHWRIRILEESKDFVWCTKQMYHFLIRLVEIWKLIVVETHSEGKWKKSLLNATSPRNKSYTFSEKRRVFGNSNSCQFEISFFQVRFYVSEARLSEISTQLVGKFSVRGQRPKNIRLFKKELLSDYTAGISRLPTQPRCLRKACTHKWQ